jgi:hypothetical protein
MIRHVVSVSTLEFENIILGKAEYLIRFFKKRPDFLSQLQKGDLMHLRKKGGEVLAQFNVGKLILIEGIEKADYKILIEFSKEVTRENFEERVSENSIMVIVRIVKLEQFITSPIEVPRGKKDWVILEI